MRFGDEERRVIVLVRRRSFVAGCGSLGPEPEETWQKKYFRSHTTPVNKNNGESTIGKSHLLRQPITKIRGYRRKKGTVA
jgi:hypothetical protein